MADKNFGVRAGLELRMNTWANQLSRDKQYPWVGTGLIEDLKAAAKALGGPEFENQFPEVPAPLDPPKYDL